MLKEFLKRRGVLYGLISIVFAAIMLKLRQVFFIDNIILWNIIFILTWTFWGVVLGSIIQRQYLSLQTDELTNLSNYKALQKSLEEQLESTQKTKEDLSMLIIDIDYFKIVNDLRGHLVGDKLLAALATIMREMFPISAEFFRWGGEEFVILLPKTNNKKAFYLAENFRQRVMSSKEFENNTVSIGLATCNDNIGKDHFFDLVDKAMYQAKINRNCVHNAGNIC